MTCIAACFFGLLLQVRPKVYAVPKYAVKSEVKTLQEGVWPGSPVGENGESQAEFVRHEYVPTALRLLVRADCSTDINNLDLIERAKSTTTDNSPVGQIDWGRISNDQVVFYGVFCTVTRTTRVNMTANEGKYMIDRHTIDEVPKWEVRRINMAKLGGTCVDERKLVQRDLAAGVMNMLNQISGDTIRSRNFN